MDTSKFIYRIATIVALRKESVDRNFDLAIVDPPYGIGSLSARRAWIEIFTK